MCDSALYRYGGPCSSQTTNTTFELQTPAERMRYFNVVNYPSEATIARVIQGVQAPPLTLEQTLERNKSQFNVATKNYNHLEKDKYFPLEQKPVDTEVSLRKLEDGMLFKSMGPYYANRVYVPPRVFGGEIPVPRGHWVPDPQAYNPFLGKRMEMF